MDKTVVELFAGVGGFRVGLNDIHGFDESGRAIENREWDFVWANQWEPSTKVQHAFDCYVRRFGDSENHVNEDISLVDKRTIPDHTLLVGGFPCQDYSVARTLSGEKGIEGKKGVLFWQIAQILETKQPPLVLLENVDRLLKSPARQRGRDFGVMLRTLYDLGYNVEWRVINAADYGCAQRRRRVFIFGWRRELKYQLQINECSSEELILTNGIFAKAFPIQKCIKASKKVDLKDFDDTVVITEKFKFEFANSGIMLDGIVTTAVTESICEPLTTLGMIREENKDLKKYLLTDDKDEKFRYLRSSKKILRKKPNGEPYYYSEGAMAYPDSLDLPGRTMLTSEGTVNRSTHVIEDEQTGKLRLITPIEAERMQSFPDDWTNTGMTDSRRYFMMGNALVTALVNRLETYLSQIIENE